VIEFVYNKVNRFSRRAMRRGLRDRISNQERANDGTGIIIWREAS
jgi:hypothetical protein